MASIEIFKNCHENIRNHEEEAFPKICNVFFFRQPDFDFEINSPSDPVPLGQDSKINDDHNFHEHRKEIPDSL